MISLLDEFCFDVFLRGLNVPIFVWIPGYDSESEDYEPERDKNRYFRGYRDEEDEHCTSESIEKLKHSEHLQVVVEVLTVKRKAVGAVNCGQHPPNEDHHAV